MPQAIKMHKPKSAFSNSKQGGRNPMRTLKMNGKAWANLRALVFNIEPRCKVCLLMGKAEPATDVDHWDNDPSNNQLQNLVPLCHSCHSKMTTADQRGIDRDTALEAMLNKQREYDDMVRAEKSPATESHAPPVTPTTHGRNIGVLENAKT